MMKCYAFLVLLSSSLATAENLSSGRNGVDGADLMHVADRLDDGRISSALLLMYVLLSDDINDNAASISAQWTDQIRQTVIDGKVADKNYRRGLVEDVSIVVILIESSGGCVGVESCGDSVGWKEKTLVV